MRVAVVSDTHSKKLPPQLVADLKKSDLIIHVGDFCTPEDYALLAGLQKIEAVCGNMDLPQMSKQLPRKRVFKCEGLNIGLFHGEGAPRLLLDRVKAEFAKDNVDVVVFGHSHHPLNEQIGKVLYFNPGSPTDTIYAPYRSYGILEINDKTVVGKIIRLED